MHKKRVPERALCYYFLKYGPIHPLKIPKFLWQIAHLTLLLLCLLCRAELYPKNIAFQQVLENKDIALGSVFEVFQDSEGFIWFGAENALVRYDSYTLKPIYLYDDLEGKTERKTVSVRDIVEDDQGTIWVASNRGLLYYDRQFDRLAGVPEHPSLMRAPLSQSHLRALENLHDGQLAIASYTGLYIVNPRTGKGDFYQTTTPNGIQYNRVRSLTFDGENTLWIGTGFGLDRMNIATGVIDHFRPYSEDPDSIPHNCITSIILDAEGLLWLGTRRGILHFNPTTHQYTSYLYGPNDTNKIKDGDVWTLFEGAGGLYWVGTENGLIQFDPKTKRSVVFRHEPGRTNSLSSNVIRNVFKDKDNNIWVGTFPTGVNYIDRRNESVTTYTQSANDSNSLSHNSVLSIVEDSRGNLWLGTDGGGLNYLNRQTNTFTHYLSEEDDSRTIGSNRVLTLMIDSQNILWGGTWNGGVFMLDLQTNKITRLPGIKEAQFIPGVTRSRFLNNDKVWTILEDRLGYIWMGTIRGGLSRYDRNTGEFIHYIHSDSDPTTIPENHVWTVFEDSTGTFWVGTSGGLSILDRETHTFSTFDDTSRSISPPSSWSVQSFFEDSQNRMWIGTNNGLNLYDRKENSFVRFGIKDGFIDASIRSISEDQFGRLWLGTNSGVTLFSPDTLQVKNYNREGGKLVDGFNYNAAVMTEAGEAILGGKDGLRLFQTQKIEFSQRLNDVVITDFKIFNESVIYGKPGSPLSGPISKATHITLQPDVSFFSFEFSALNYSSAEKIQYAYRLDGFDSKWNNLGFRRTATYTNLDPGHYVFKVKAADEGGVWSDRSTNISIEILPPWWRTWWAYCLYLVVALCLYVHYRRSRELRRLIEEKNSNLAIKRKLSQRITKILEDERKVLAKEVHDNINATVIATRMITQSIERLIQAEKVDTGKILQLAQKADQQLSETYDFFRSLLRKLRPEIIETLGFDGALQELTESYNNIHPSCNFELSIEGEKWPVSEDMGIGLYRIAQEAITNAIKHASPTLVNIDLSYQKTGLTMSISDNGCGFSRDAQPGLGIEHMRERVQSLNGRLSIDRPQGPNKTGTVIKAYVPVTESPEL